ncbi:hypothetical protein ACFV1W_37980 [Kitasatospora sp. NPDC059648]|uniref:hypothetical protein n=1 Tax=Kitasatospora sp. NPDC059648 TaxID=3346894 RepID=UPI0036A3998F
MVLRHRDVTPVGDSAHVYQACWAALRLNGALSEGPVTALAHPSLSRSQFVMPAIRLSVRGARLAAAVTAGVTLIAGALGLAMLGTGTHTSTTGQARSAVTGVPPFGTSPAAATATASASATAAQPGTPSAPSASAVRPDTARLSSGTASPVASASSTGAHSAPPPPVPGRPQTQVLGARLDGFPATLARDRQPVEFTAVISNPTATDYPSVAPLFQLVGGPCNCADGTLQLLDPASSTWRDVTMPSGDGGAPASYVGAGVALPAHGSLTFHYRFTLSNRNSAKEAFAMLYAIDTTDKRELALSSTPSRIG